MSTNATTELITRLSDFDWEERQKAADMLAILGPTARDALTSLRDQFVSEEDPDVQGSIVKAIAKIEEDKSALVQELLNYLGNASFQTRNAAAEMLADLGPTARVALGSLWNRLLTDDDDYVLNSAARAIAAIDSEKAALVTKCIDFLREGNLKKARAGTMILAALELSGAEASKASEALWSAIKLNLDAEVTILAFKTIIQLAPNKGEVLISLIDNLNITPLTKSDLILLPDVQPILDDIWKSKMSAVLDLILGRLEQDDVDKESAIVWLTEKRAEIPSNLAERALSVLYESFKKDGTGFDAIGAFGGSVAIDRLIKDPEISPAVLGSALLIEAENVLNEKWNSDKEIILAAILAALETRQWETRYEAANWLKNKASEIPTGSYNRVVEAVTKVQNERGPAHVVSAVSAALIQLVQREKDVKTSPLLGVIRDKEANEDMKVEAIAKLVEAGAREPLRALTSEWVHWIASGNKTLVEATAESMRSCSVAVQPLIDQLLQEWQPDGELKANIRSELLPLEYRVMLLNVYDGYRLENLTQKSLMGEWLLTVGQASEKIIEVRKAAALNKWSAEKLAKEIIDILVIDELQTRALKVQYRIAKQLADMSDPKFFDEEAMKDNYSKIRDELKRHVVPVLGRRLPREENVEIRESMAQALGYIGGREAIDALSRAVAGEERIRSARQELLAKYYLEPSKARSEEAANILKEAADEAKRTLRLQHRLNVAVFSVGLVILTAGLLASIFMTDATSRVVGALAGMGGLAGLITQMIKAPIDRVQHAMANLVQIETAFTSFIWELNLNGTYIQSQYVAQGVLTDNEIGQTVSRIEEAMTLAMNLVAVYTQDRGQRIVTRINNLLPAAGPVGCSVTVAGQHLQGDSSEKKERAGIIAIDHRPINSTDSSWNDREVKFKLPDELSGFQERNGTVWVSLFIDGMETNALPFHVV